MSISFPPARWPLSRWAVLLLPILLATCSEATALGINRFVLVAIDGALPGPIPGREDVEATAGTLEVRTDDRIELRLDLRCVGGASCSLPPEWERLGGRLDRASGSGSDLGLVRWSDGREATLATAEGGVELAFPLSPSQGVGTSVFRFE